MSSLSERAVGGARGGYGSLPVVGEGSGPEATRIAARLVRALAPANLGVRPRWLWTAGSAAALVVVAGAVAGLVARGHDLELAIAAAIGAVGVVAASRAEATVLALLVGLLPFDTVALAALFRLHVPHTALRAAGAWYELAVAALVLAALRRRRRLDGLDLLALGYLVIPTVELVAPGVLAKPVSLGGFPPPSWYTRLLAWRADTLFVLVFLAARGLRLGERARRRLVGVLLRTGGVVAAIGCFEFVASSRWNAFSTRVLEVPLYKLAVLNVHSPLGLGNVEIREVVGGHLVTRVGSVLFSPVALGFYLVAVVAVALEAFVVARGGSRLSLGVLALAAVALLATVTRSAILSAAVAGLVVLRARKPQPTTGVAPGDDGFSARRVRLVLLGLVAAVLLVPVAAATGATSRSAAGLSGGQDVAQHFTALERGLHAMVSDPLGRGLGTAPGVGNRFDVSGELTSESAYLQVGDELGIPELVVFLALYLALLVGLARRAEADRSGLAGGLFAAGVALAVGGLFLHVWLDPTLSLSFFGLAGAALGGVEPERGTAAPSEVSVPAGRATRWVEVAGRLKDGAA